MRKEHTDVTAKLAELGIDASEEPGEASFKPEIKTERDDYATDEDDDGWPAESDPDAIPAAPAKANGALPKDEVRPPSLRSTLFEQSARFGSAEPVQEMAPAVVVPSPKIRKEKIAPSPSVRKLGVKLANKLPGAERVRISRRLENGQLGVIGEYGVNDLSGSSDLEAFVLKYVRPKYGAGAYKIHGIDAGGNLLDAGEITMIEPEVPQEAMGMQGLVQQLLDKQEQAQRELMEQRMTPGPDPISMLKGLQEVSRDMAAPPKDDSALGALVAAQAQQTQAMLAMVGNIITASMTPREDPTLKLLLAKLLDSKESASVPLPPPPPPPPAFSFKEMVESVVALLPAVVPLLGFFKREDETKSLLKDLLSARESDRLSPKEVIQLMQDLSSKNAAVTTPISSENSLKQSVENLSLIMGVAQSLRPSEPSAAAGFWDALAGLFSNRDFAGSIANAIRARAEAVQQKAVIDAKTHLVEKQASLVARMRQGQPPTAQVAAPTAPVAPVVPMPQAARPGPHPEPPSPSPRPVPAQRPLQVVQPPKPAAVEAQAAPVQAEAAPAVRLPELPANTGEHVKAIIEATNDAELVERAVRMIVYFAEFPEWRPIAEMLLGLIQRGEKQAALQLLAGLFTGLAQTGVLPARKAQELIRMFNQYFDEIRAEVAELPPFSVTDNPVEEALLDAEAGDEEEEEEEEDEDEEEEEEDESAEDAEDEASEDEEDTAVAAPEPLVTPAPAPEKAKRAPAKRKAAG